MASSAVTADGGADEGADGGTLGGVGISSKNESRSIVGGWAEDCDEEEV